MIEIPVFGILLLVCFGFVVGGIVIWRIMINTTVSDAQEASMEFMREQEATEKTLMFFVGHIKGGQYWSPRMQKIYATWKDDMNYDEDAPSNKT